MDSQQPTAASAGQPSADPSLARCTAPACRGAVLVRFDPESSWTATRYACPKCGRPYTVMTTLGKVAQVAPIATVGALLLRSILAALGGDDDLAE